MNADEEEKILKNLNPKEAVDISKVITTHTIAPKQYYMFRTGGPHFLIDVKIKKLLMLNF